MKIENDKVYYLAMVTIASINGSITLDFWNADKAAAVLAAKNCYDKIVGFIIYNNENYAIEITHKSEEVRDGQTVTVGEEKHMFSRDVLALSRISIIVNKLFAKKCRSSEVNVTFI